MNDEELTTVECPECHIKFAVVSTYKHVITCPYCVTEIGYLHRHVKP